MSLEVVSPGDELKHSLLQLGAWNIQGKTMESALDTLSDFELDLHVVAFEEASRLCLEASGVEVGASEHAAYLILTAQPPGFLGL